MESVSYKEFHFEKVITSSLFPMFFEKSKLLLGQFWNVTQPNNSSAFFSVSQVFDRLGLS